MSITTYDELKTAVARWMKRDDLTAYIPDYIALAETRFWYGNKGPFPTVPLRFMYMQAEASGTVGVGGIIQPSANLLELISISVTSGGVTIPLRYLSPAQLAEKSTDSNTPQFYTFRNQAIYVAGSGAATYSYDGYSKFESLSSSVTSNPLLAYHPDIYLMGACLEGCIDTQNDQAAARFASNLAGRINALTANDAARHAGGSLAVTVAR